MFNILLLTSINSSFLFVQKEGSIRKKMPLTARHVCFLLAPTDSILSEGLEQGVFEAPSD